MKKLSLVLFALLSTNSLWAVIAFTENFEGGIPGFYGAGETLTGTKLRVVAGSADIKGDTFYAWFCQLPSNGLCLDTTGSTSTLPGRGVVESTDLIELLPGLAQLSFSLVRWNDAPPTGVGIGAYDASITVSFGDLFSETFIVDSNWVNQTIVRSIDVKAPASARFKITDNGGNLHSGGAIVDDILILSGIPEPGTMLLLGSALALAGAVRRRR